MLTHLISAALQAMRSPLAYPWRCLAGNSVRTLTRRLGRVRRVAAGILGCNLQPELPIRLQTETTDFCNLKCIMCTREVLPGMNSSSIPLETFRRLIDEVKPLYVTMNGLGEPLLDKTIFEKLELLHARGIMTSMPTNGTYIRRSNLDRLARQLPDILQLSIDGATRESFESIRKQGDFAQIIGNYRALARLRATGQSRPRTSIRVLCALQKKNLFDYREMYHLYKSIPQVSFSLVPVFEYDSANGTFADITPSTEDVGRLRTQIDSTIRITSSRQEREFYRSWRHAATSWLDQGAYERGTVREGSCSVPWYSSYVDAKSRVYPCCHLTETHHVMGNLHQNSFPDIWRGGRYSEFRRRLVEDRANLEGCRTCPRNDSRLLAALQRVRPLLPALPDADAAPSTGLGPQG
jgi:radical SAM protein with 4Fe4S-binding SPASM domain